MNVKSTIMAEEVKKEIIVSNPDNRKVLIDTYENGLLEPQLFLSSAFPKEITYRLLGLVKFPDGNFYPKYICETVSDFSLVLTGYPSYEEGINVINRVCFELTWQEGMLQAGSVKRSDLKYFDYRNEDLSYWLASPGIYGWYDNNHFGPGNVISGVTDSGYGGILQNSRCFISGYLPVRPTMVLNSKVVKSPLFDSLVKL